MPDNETGEHSEKSEKKATENVLMQKFGPLPLIVWVAIAAGVVGAILYLRNRSASSSTTVPVAATGIPGTAGSGAVGDSGSGSSSGPTPVSPTDPTITGITDEITALQKSITDQFSAVAANETSLGSTIASNQQTTSAGLTALGNSINSLANRPTPPAAGATNPEGQTLSDISSSGSFTGTAADAAWIDTLMGQTGYSVTNPGEANKILQQNQSDQAAAGHAGEYFDIGGPGRASGWKPNQ